MPDAKNTADELLDKLPPIREKKDGVPTATGPDGEEIKLWQHFGPFILGEIIPDGTAISIQDKDIDDITDKDGTRTITVKSYKVKPTK